MRNPRGSESPRGLGISLRQYLVDVFPGLADRNDETIWPEGESELVADKVAVYRNRRRMRGAHGKGLMRQRGEYKYIERSFAHLCETGRCGEFNCEDGIIFGSAC